MTKSPVVAGGLSLCVPGLGQWYNGERSKALALLCAAVGVGGCMAWYASAVSRVLLMGAYLCLVISSVRDAYQTAAGSPRRFAGEHPAYVVWMLLLLGPFALPLLWQSPRFSHKAKQIWTVVVLLVVIVGVWVLGAIGPALEEALREYQRLL